MTIARKLEIVPSNNIQYAAVLVAERYFESRNVVSGIKLFDRIV